LPLDVNQQFVRVAALALSHWSPRLTPARGLRTGFCHGAIRSAINFAP
jgi:hypothetical protein